MTQNALDYSQNPSGVELMDVYLAGMADNQLTNHSGVSRPSYAQAGTFWIDTSVTPWLLKQFNGTADVVIGTLDQTNLYFTAARALGDKNGNDIATTYLTTTGTAAKATADGEGNVITSTYLTTTGTAAKATADGEGNVITSTYAKLAENNTFTGNILSKGGLNKVLDAVLGTTPSSVKSADFGVIDNNGTWLGGWGSFYDTDGSITKQISVKKQDGTNNYATFMIGYNGQGKEFMSASPGVTSDMSYYGMPNYTAMVSKSDNVAYTADTNGFIIWQPKIERGYNKYILTIEGQQIGYGGNEDWTNNCLRAVYPIKKGVTYSSSGSSEFYFAPAVGG